MKSRASFPLNFLQQFNRVSKKEQKITPALFMARQKYRKIRIYFISIALFVSLESGKLWPGVSSCHLKQMSPVIRGVVEFTTCKVELFINELCRLRLDKHPPATASAGESL